MSTSDVADDHQLDGFLLRAPLQFKWVQEISFAVEEAEKIAQALWYTPLSDKEVVNIDKKHTFLETVDEPLLIVHRSSNYLPINCVVIG